mmetsp:Transcript_13822/g.16034  ORF Transcript_13822/g.16034 Transcript_13822/m.16034 type:complete len:85 (+) Transcript_13822:127-381(+)
MPIYPPGIADEIRYSEVDVSLYSEFSDDEESLTDDAKSKNEDSVEKAMFSMQIIDKMLNFCDPAVVQIFNLLGAFKIKPTDISK